MNQHENKIGNEVRNMDFLFHSMNIDIRIMSYYDIPFICRADADESQENIAYLKRQLDNQEKSECTALLALYDGTSQDMYFYTFNADGVGWLAIIFRV